MAQDRIQDGTLPITHEVLSDKLGMRRAGVTEALKALRQRGLISYRRAEITIGDRKGLTRFAGEAYGTPESEFRHLIG
jgi:CRP-like cAMP-binding protein